MKIIIVTGASKGLGLAITHSLLSANYFVVAIARTKSHELEGLMQQWPDLIAFEPFDLTRLDDIHALCTQIGKSYGRIYGLINNAAVGRDGVLATMHESQIGEMLTLNIQAPILLSKYLLRPMLINQTGRIINISSIIAATGYSGLSVYGASKAAISGFTKSLCREVGKANITVNTIAPGFMETQMTETLNESKLEKIKRRSPLNKLASVEDVAQAVIYLLSDSASSITGATLTIDAGSTA